MSSRVLKKLQGDNDFNIKEQDEQLSDLETGEMDAEIGGDTTVGGVIASSGSNCGGAKKKQFNINRYDLLNAQSPSESEVKEDDNETEHASAANNAHVCESKKKKKKRKKKSGKNSTAQRRSSEDNADMDDLTRTVKEVNKLFDDNNHDLPASPITSSAILASSSATKTLLSVQHKNLNASYEMKRMFGSRVVQAEQQQQQQKRRNMRGISGGTNSGQRSTLKTTWLVNAKENWPPVRKMGIYMNVIQNPSGDDSGGAAGTVTATDKNIIYFTFEHSPNYRQLQQKFLHAVESMDSDNIIQIINQQPYHVDSLVQLSELCKMSEDHAMASELIEHALLAIESSFHSMFSLTSGNCRIDYRRQENRSLFIVLFKHSQYLESRACSRTALEIAKLILTLDPINDPLAVILIIDYYAIRSKQYEWLVQLYNEWEVTNNLSQLPNMAYSYALALFYINKNNDKNGETLTTADKALQYALLMFPGVLKLLIEVLSINVDKRCSQHNYIKITSNEAPPALQQLNALYVCRSNIIWRDQELLPWLEKNVNIILDRVDAKDNIIQEYAFKRNQRYKSPPREILRHIVLSDFKEKVPLAPFINTNSEPIVMYDPLPPLDSINIYQKPNMKPGTRIIQGSPFQMFFQSLLPTFNIEHNQRVEIDLDNAAADLQDQAAGGGDTGGSMQSYTELRSSLNSIVDTMRDFLSNIRVPERLNDADVDENESTDDDETHDYLT